MAQLRNLFAIGEKIEYTSEASAGSTLVQELQLWDDYDYMQLEAEPYNGVASIVWNGYLRNRFQEGYATLPAGRALFRWDRNVCHKIEVDADGAPEKLVWVTRGRLLPKNNIGSMYEISAKHYAGFPLDIVYCLTAGTKADQSRATTSLTIDNRFALSISDGRAEVVSVRATGVTDIRLYAMINGEAYEEVWNGRVQEAEVPDNAFYIRWIGRLGGYEHMMLSCKQKHALNIESLSTYERVTDAGIKHTADVEVSHKVSASTGMITRDTIEKMASILYSPYIQYYDTERGEWVTIQLGKGQKINWTTEQAQGEIELTFDIPNRTYTN